MITKEVAKRHTMRLGQMVGFPRDSREALEELILAVQVAPHEELARECIAAFLETADSSTRCPMPSQLRIWLHDRVKTEEDKRRQRCEECGDAGYVTRWFLVTYRCQSPSVIRSEPLLDIHTHEQAHEFAAKLAANPNPPENRQTVLSAATPCVCLPVTHHARTGEA